MSRCSPQCCDKGATRDERWWPAFLSVLQTLLLFITHIYACIYAYSLCVWVYIYISQQRTARALTAGPPLSPGWVMANNPAWCHGPYLRARECEGRDGQRSRGWMGVWKDGLEQPVVKDRRSLTGADADTSATALHHLPFTGHANHALRRKPARCFPSSPSLSPTLPLSSHTHAEQQHDPSCIWTEKWVEWDIHTFGGEWAEPVKCCFLRLELNWKTQTVIPKHSRTAWTWIPGHSRSDVQGLCSSLYIRGQQISSLPLFQISPLGKGIRRAPCSPTEPSTAA